MVVKAIVRLLSTVSQLALSLPSFYSNFELIFTSHELLTNVPSNQIYASSTLNKEYYYHIWDFIDFFVA